jgi:uncharacterized protein (TIGR02996 family)
VKAPAVRTVHDALLRDVLLTPGDDAPRLILADWLEEHGGDPGRAEFIRTQCELARLAGVMPAPRFDAAGRELAQPGTALRRRAQELLDANAPAWLGEPLGGRPFGWGGWGEAVAPARPGGPPWRALWRRGFVESATLTWADFLAPGAADLFSAHPVTLVDLSDCVPAPLPNGIEVRWYRRPQVPAPPAGRFPDSFIPAELFDLLEGGRVREAPEWHTCRDAADARRKLSAACVAFGRGAAGLG